MTLCFLTIVGMALGAWAQELPPFPTETIAPAQNLGRAAMTFAETRSPIAKVDDAARIKKLVPFGDQSRLTDAARMETLTVVAPSPAPFFLLVWEQPPKGTNGIAQYWDVEASDDLRQWTVIATKWNPDPFVWQSVTNAVESRFSHRNYRVGAGNGRREP